MDLTVNLDRDTLSLIKEAFIKRRILSVNGDGDSFKQITLDVFVNIAMEQLNSVNDDDLCYTNTSNVTSDDKVKDTKMIKMLVHIFDSVDVDSKGFIVWDDLVSYCLQACKNIFLPTVKNSGIEYTQTTKCSSHMHGRKLYYSQNISMLFVLEAESAQLSYFRTCGDLSGKINIIKEFLKHQRLNTSVSVTYHSKKADKTTASENLLSKKNFTARGSLLCMTPIPPFSFAFSTSNSFIVFCNYDLTSKNFLVVGHCECPDKQVGMQYVSQSNLLLTWPGDASDHCFRFWDVKTYQLKYIVQRHKDTILAVCEVKFHPTGYIVSSSIDRKLTLWSLNPLSGDNDVYDLRGHKHALRSLVFAKKHELIIGAGFDFDFYAWDLVTKELQMKFHGHIYSVIRLHLIEVPNERVVSLDEWGYLKVWNLDQAAVLQSLLLDYNRKVRIVDFCPCFRHGLDLAFLVDKVNFCRLDDHSQNCPISGGLGYCERYGKLHMITDSLLTCCRLRDGSILKRFALLSDNHVDVNKFSNGSLDLSKFDISHDKLTCATVDKVGKKLFLATSEGHILLFNALSIHLVKVLALNEKSNMHGSIVTLHYVERDRLLVVGYGGGGVRIINGCHHVDQVPGDRHESICNDLYKPYDVQSTPPSKPECLRECEYDFIHDQGLGMAVSDAFRLIAIVSVHGIVRVFDYFTLKVLTIFSIPRCNDGDVECTTINFIPNAPVIVVSDTVGRITMFAVRPLKNDFVVTFTPLCLFYKSLKDGTADIPNTPAIRSVECMCWVEDPIVRAACLVEQDLKSKGKKRNPPNATSGVEKSCFCWKIVVGDDEGTIFLVDITSLLERLGVHLNESKAPTFTYSPYVISNNKLVSLLDATDRSQVASFELLVKRPIGVDVDVKARSSLLRFIKGDKKWKGHKTRCVQIKAVIDNRLFWEKNNNGTFDVVRDLDRFPIQPKQVLSSSDTGDVKLWTLDGSLLGGLTEAVDDDEQKEREKEPSVFAADERKDCQSLKWKLTALESSDVSLVVQRKYLSLAKTLSRVKKLDTMSGIITTSIAEWQQYVDSGISDSNGYHRYEPFLESLVAWLQGAITKPTSSQQQQQHALANEEDEEDEEDEEEAVEKKTRLFGSSVSHMSLDLAEGSTTSDINAYYKWKETLVPMPSDKAGLGSVRLMSAVVMTRRPEDSLKEHILGSEEWDHHGPRPGSVCYKNYQIEEQRKSQNYAKERLRKTNVNLSEYLTPERAAALAKNETRKLTRARPSTAPNKRRTAAERVSLVDRFHLMQDDKHIDKHMDKHMDKPLTSSLQSPVASDVAIARESRQKKMGEILEALTIEKPATTMSFFSPLQTEYSMKAADDGATEENKTEPFLTLADRLHRTTLKVSALDDEAKGAPVTKEKKHPKHRVHKAMIDANNGIIDVMKVEQERLKLTTHKIVTVSTHNIRSRYGPYKLTDLMSVLNLYCPLASKQWFSEADEGNKGGYAWDDDYILDFDEIMHSPDVKDNQFLRSAFTSIKEFGTTEDCVYLRDIIKLFYPLAFDVEQIRIFCFIVAMDALYTFLKCCAPPLPPPPPSSSSSSSSSLMRIAAKKAVDYSRGIVSTLAPDKVRGFRGWYIQHQYLTDLKSTFKRLYEQESGTVTVGDVLDVLFLTIPTKLSKDCKPLQYLRTRIKQDWDISLDSEVSSELISRIVVDGLKIKVRYPPKQLDAAMADAVAVYDNLIESAIGHSPVPIRRNNTFLDEIANSN